MKSGKQFFLLILLASTTFCAAAQTYSTTEVRIKILEQDTKRTTPAMVCITNVRDSLPRVPPDGALAGKPTELPLFFSGVSYHAGKDWVGPVRMTNGKGSGENRSVLYELKPSLPHWKEPVMYQVSGDFNINLPTGKWRIAIEHGTEYIPLIAHFEVTGKEKTLFQTYTLQRWINLPRRGWWSGDVHVHHPTNKPEYKDYLLQFAKAEDLHIVNMLEMGHHLGTDFKVDGFGKKFRQCLENYCLISGQEDPRTDYGHIIGLNIESQVRDTSVYNYYDWVFKKLQLQPGAVVGYAHFSWTGFERGFPWHIASNEIDFVELLQFLKLNTPDYYDFLNLGFKITAAAGSDFPWASTIGDVRTFVYTGPDYSIDKWFAGLKQGNTFVSNGPVLFFEADGQLPGTVVKQKGSAQTVLKAKAIAHPGIGTIRRLAIYNNDGLVAEQMNETKRDSLEIILPHTVKQSQWIAAIVDCDNGAVAHTTPIYFLIDGQPTYSRTKGPEIIQKQMAFIEKIRRMELDKPAVDQVILEQLSKAEQFYANLLSAMRR